MPMTSANFHNRWVLTAFFAFFLSCLSHAWSQKPRFGDALGLPVVPDLGVDSGSHVTYTAEYSIAPNSRKGELRITATIDPPWHTYSVSQAKGGPLPTVIEADKKRISLGAISAEPAPHIIRIEDLYPGLPIEEHTDRVVWSAPFEMVGDWKPGETEIDVTVSGLVCMPPPDGSCIPVKEKLKAKLMTQTPVAPLSAFRAPKSHADVSVYVEPAEIRPGGNATLVVSIEPEPPYHVYSFVAEDVETEFRTLIVPTQKSDLLFGPPVTTSPTKSIKDLVKEHLIHEKKVEWRIPIRVPDSIALAKLPLEIMLGYSTCTDQTCDPPAGVIASGELNVVAAPGATPRSAFVVKAAAFRDVAKQPKLASWIDFQPESTVQAEVREVKEKATDGQLSVWTILAALIGGFILNFMPCVLPVIGLKVFGFVEQAGSNRAEIIKLNLAYVLGILAVMWVLAAITVATKNTFGWGQQFTLIEFKVAMAVLVFAMGLSFLGVWEIPIPGFASSAKSTKLMQREGLVGAFSKGLLTTILATPCTGPFLGAAFAVTLTLPPVGVFVVYTMVGLGMGLPFLLLCLQPSLVKVLPKPGVWMEVLKEALAFPLLLTVVYFIASMGQDYRVAALSLLIAVWFGCWLIGKVPVYADFHRKVQTWGVALAVTAVWGMLSFSYLGPSKSDLPWEAFSPARLEMLQKSGKTVMIDFTANWCLNCQYNTVWSIEKPGVAQLIEKNGVAPLLADWTEPSDVIEAHIQSLGKKAIPLLVIYPAEPNRQPIILDGVITQQQLIDALKEAGPSRMAGKMTSANEETQAKAR